MVSESSSNSAPSIWRKPLITLALCCVIGVLAAYGVFSFISGFPIIFCGIVVLLGLAGLRQESRFQLVPRVLVMLFALAPPLVGYRLHEQHVDRGQRQLQAELSKRLVGSRISQLPDLRFLDEQTINQESILQLEGTATVVAFWGYWCSPCWKELPELDELYRAHKSKGLTVLAVTRFNAKSESEQASELTRIHEYVAKNQFDMPFAIAEQSDIYDTFLVQSIPTTVLLNSDGQVMGVGIGLDGGREIISQAKRLTLQ